MASWAPHPSSAARRVVVASIVAIVIAGAPAVATTAEPRDPELRHSVLEDFYGASGETFQGAIGFYTQEGSGTALVPNSGFGLAIDDVVIEWREFRLDPDTTSCGASTGTCAVLTFGSTNFFEASSFIQLGVIDETPYDPTNAVNDCNNDGDYVDAGIDDQDCDDDGVTDVLVRVTSEAEPTGEVVILDRIGTTAAYRGNVPISTSSNSTHVLFLSRTGTDHPTVIARYVDRDIDGVLPVAPCPNDPDPAKRGTIFASTTVFVDGGRISLASIALDDDALGGTSGDDDGFADTNETVDVTATFTNRSGVAQTDVVASVLSETKYCLDDGTKTAFNPCATGADCAAGRTCTAVIECISRPSVRVGDLGTDNCTGPANCRTRQAPAAFRFKVANVNRIALSDALDAVFVVTIRSKAIDVLTRRVEFTIPLDLSASGGGSPTSFFEGFEGAGFGQFTSMELDAGKASVAGSDGYRCQFNDPAGPNSNDPGRTSCYLGFTTASSNAYDWHQHTTGADNGVPRAYGGTKSLHWGVHPVTGPQRDDTRFSQLDAVRTTGPIHLSPAGSASPTLSFKHQISLTDSRTTGTPFGESADRAAVAIQISDAGGAFIGNWIKIYPYENEYDVQGTDNFLNCMFDPVDDGNDEDSFFDPSDPLRRTGPSTTCFPEFVFGWQGDTDWRHSPAILSNIGRAFDGPGLAGATGPGTWIEPKFNLFGYKGKSIRLRFLATTIEVSGAVTVNDTNIGRDNNTGDDGWYIDDVAVTGTLTAPVTLSVDTSTAARPPCDVCSTIAPSLTATPTATIAPGQPVRLDAATSSADFCPSGTLQFQFWDDANPGTPVGGFGDALLRDWSDNPALADAPLATTRYAVLVRCSTDTSCGAGSSSAIAPVTVGCPNTGTFPPALFDGTIGFPVDPTKSTVGWAASQLHDAIRGDLGALRSTGHFAGTVLSCLANDVVGASVTDGTAPPSGSGYYYLTRPGGTEYYCNRPSSWNDAGPTGAGGQPAAKDAQVNASVNVCP